MVHLGNNVARLRGFRQLPQKEVASRLNISQQDYSKIETKAEIDEDLLFRIATAIDFPVDLIKELENASIQTIHNSGEITSSIFYQNNPVEKLIEVYEQLLKEKDEVIKSKDAVIELLKGKPN